jgi:pimeloyl-ACP methyl ester carboxylesterase
LDYGVPKLYRGDAMLDLEPFTVQVTEEEIASLRDRLAATRWPDQLPGAGWDYGTERAALQELCAYWAQDFDWSQFLSRANRHPQWMATLDNQRIHFIHARSTEPQARPLIITHGWPGSVAEFYEVVGPLADPVAHGGRAEDAFHVVCPSLPGYGFSGPTTERGWTAHRVADAFIGLMAGLGYERFFAQGGDWGSLVTNSMAARYPERIAAFHLNLVNAGPPSGSDDPMVGVTEREQAALASMQDFFAHETGYQSIQSTKPQTLAYALTDSPAGLAGWILEKFQRWSDCGGDPRRSYSFDRLLDNISVYWLTGTINSSMRLYYETIGPGRGQRLPRSTVPMGHTVFPGEIYSAPRAWVEAAFNLVYWSEQPAGGHFAAMEVPGPFVEEIRACFQGRTA